MPPKQELTKVTFDEFNLNAPLRNALEELGYIYPTPIQQSTFPVAMSGRDVIGIAQTGTGKTFAYLLPILRQLSYSDQKQPRVVIIVPTRELVLQVIKEIESLTPYMTVRIAGVYGGANINTQRQVIHNGLDILVATPGRLFDLALTGVLRFKSVQKLVIDEVDEMLNMGFRPQLMSILDLLPEKRQNLMYSATLTPDVEAIIDLYFDKPERIEEAPHGTPLDSIDQRTYFVPNYNTKVNMLEHLLVNDEDMSRVLIFVRNKRIADKLHEHLSEKHPGKIGVIHSNKAPNTRVNALNRFKNGESKALIATDIISRGLDISDVSHVINFDTPMEAPDYIHRIGRTGRADKTGVAINLVVKEDEELLMAVERLIKRPIPASPLPEDLKISTVLTEDEKQAPLYDKNYLKAPSIKHSKGNFHEKKEKNKKVNLGGPSKRNDKRKAKFNSNKSSQAPKSGKMFF